MCSDTCFLMHFIGLTFLPFPALGSPDLALPPFSLPFLLVAASCIPQTIVEQQDNNGEKQWRRFVEWSGMGGKERACVALSSFKRKKEVLDSLKTRSESQYTHTRSRKHKRNTHTHTHTHTHRLKYKHKASRNRARGGLRL